MRLHSGASSALEPSTAAHEAVRAALSGAAAPVVAFVFATEQYPADELAQALNRELGDLPWAGCCTGGVIAGTSVLRQGVVVGVLSSTTSHAGIGVGLQVSERPRKAGAAAVSEAIANLPAVVARGRRTLVVFSDAQAGNTAEVVRGAAGEAGADVQWAGGGAGDHLHSLAQFALGRALTDSVVVVAVDSELPCATGIRHGWRPYGPPSMVTQAKGRVVAELEYENAFEVYRDTASSRGDEISREDFSHFATTHPLGIPLADGQHVIRDPLTVDADGGLACVADVPDGSLVRIMEGNREALLAAAHEAAVSARARLAGDPGGALVFDCVSRSLVLGEQLEEELGRIREGLGPDVPLVGCLSFGEVGTLGSGVPQFHNKSTVVLALPAETPE